MTIAAANGLRTNAVETWESGEGCLNARENNGVADWLGALFVPRI